jgi:lipopolysaccharide export system protein LptC
MNYRRATLGLSLLVASLGLVVWNMRPEKTQKTTQALKSDYRLIDFTMLAFNEDGKEAFSLSAPLLERDPEGKSLSINKPVFTFPDGNSQIWTANAESAWVSDKAREVQLREHVTIIGPKSPKGLRTEFRSELLSVFPKENRIHSDKLVTITHGTSILKGLGLEAQMKTRRVQLLAKVQAHYAPKNR